MCTLFFLSSKVKLLKPNSSNNSKKKTENVKVLQLSFFFFAFLGPSHP